MQQTGNQADISFSQGKLEHLLSLIRQIKNSLPFLQKLEMEERKKIYRKGNKQLEYIRKTFAFAKRNPYFVPTYLDLPILTRNLYVADQLTILLKEVEEVKREIEDTRMILYKSAFDGARTLYVTYRNAAQNGVAETSEVVEELKQYFPRTGKKKI